MSPTIAIAAPSGSDRGGSPHGAMRDAERHSRTVRVLRIATPALAVALVAAAVVAAVLQPLSGEIHVDVAGLDVGGATVAMDAPTMKGFNSQDRAYEVRARTARQAIATPNQIGLEDLAAQIELADKGWARLSSRVGQYDATTQVLDLAEDVRVLSDKGDDAALAYARAEMKTGRIVSDAPVAIRMGNSRLTANRMEILDSGDRVLFQGRVRMTLKRDRAAATSAVPDPTPNATE